MGSYACAANFEYISTLWNRFSHNFPICGALSASIARIFWLQHHIFQMSVCSTDELKKVMSNNGTLLHILHLAFQGRPSLYSLRLTWNIFFLHMFFLDSSHCCISFRVIISRFTNSGFFALPFILVVNARAC